MTISPLFSPLRLRELVLRNRVVLSPMCQYMAVDGAVQDWHLAHHARFSLGGIGTALVEATGVLAEGRITHGCLGLYDDSQIAGMRRIARLYAAHGVAVGVQLAHAGRKASAAVPWEGAGPLQGSAAWKTVAPSALEAQPGWPTPRALAADEIGSVVAAFATAAKRALEAGFDFVEIHGAHGYLLHSFLSPLSNQRADSYGGDLAARMRLPLEVARAVRAVWPQDRPLFYRASVVDTQPGGATLEDTVVLARALGEAGVDVIDCSSGGIAGSSTLPAAQTGPGYQVPLAAGVRHGAGLRTMAVGMLTEPAQADAVIADGKADLVALGRGLLADPNWAFLAAGRLGVDDPYGVLPQPYAFHLRRRAMLRA